MKVVLNKKHGGFGISKECAERMAELGCQHAAAELKQWDKWSGGGYVEGFDFGYNRENPYLAQAVEELGDKANSRFSKLVVVDIPDGIEYEIDEYDGYETAREVHRSW